MLCGYAIVAVLVLSGMQVLTEMRFLRQGFANTTVGDGSSSSSSLVGQVLDFQTTSWQAFFKDDSESDDALPRADDESSVDAVADTNTDVNGSSSSLSSEATTITSSDPTAVDTPTTPSSLSSSTEPLTTDFQFCRADRVTSPGYTANDTDYSVAIEYQCAGPPYDTFVQKLQAYAHDKIVSGDRPPSWGHRPFPIPDGKTVLLFGNSHTRQLALALMCPYAAAAESGTKQRTMIITHVQHTGSGRDFDLALRIRFANQSTLWIVANSFAAYSHEWPRLLAEEMGMQGDVDLLRHSIDMVVVGLFNLCAYAQQSKFVEHMARVAAARPDDVHCQEHVYGPNVTAVSQFFDTARIVFVPMFTTSRQKDYLQTLKEIQMIRGTDNHNNKDDNANNNTAIPRISSVPARAHINAMKIECGSQEHYKVSTCRNDKAAKAIFHRCTGQHGGHADLVAWDVIEHAFATLQSRLES